MKKDDTSMVLTTAQKMKRDAFITKAVKALQQCANESGYKMISKETLSLMVQRYNDEFRPPQFPKKIKKVKSHLKIIKENSENTDKS